MRKPNWMLIGILFGVSLFLAYTLFAAAIGSFLPSINYISKPLLCSGEYKIETTRYSYKPGQVGWQHNVYCDGKDITLASISLTGLIVALVIFTALFIRYRKDMFYAKDFGILANDLKQMDKSQKGQKGKSPLERMTELKEMRDKNLISQVEYERKKDEIMKEL
ncbi:MAG: hypothetical protein OHK003_16880 [Anaerolineales bacterium]